MLPHLKILLIIFDIVKADPAPETYLCTPREIILRYADDWTSIQSHLNALEAEKLVSIRQLDKLVISITLEGLTKARALKNNFVTTKHLFPGESEHPQFLRPQD
ncbi:MAG: hypothetical protein M3040_06475 [Bacteroidota bacterium]|nr:hypothetical protein [Bacteroidota bacterium]